MHRAIQQPDFDAAFRARKLNLVIHVEEHRPVKAGSHMNYPKACRYRDMTQAGGRAQSTKNDPLPVDCTAGITGRKMKRIYVARSRAEDFQVMF